MKKTLLAAALLSGLSSAYASQITLYGNVDLGMSFSRQGGDHGDGHVSVAMKSGMRNSSRFGIRGSETLSNSYKLGFILESQFAADSGQLQTQGRLWERESSLWIEGPFGKITAGHVGYLKGVVGSTALLNSYRVNPFGSQMSNFITGYKAYTTGTTWYTNNGIVWQSPTLANTTVYVQYSNAVEDESAHYHEQDRYFAGAVRYMNGSLLLQAIIDTTARGSKTALSNDVYRDPISFGLQAAYDFGPVKAFAMAETFRDSPLNTVGGYLKGNGLFDGTGGTFVLQWPALGGKAKMGGGLMKASSSSGYSTITSDVTRMGASVGYDYALTKRTNLYVNYGYIKQKTEKAQGTVRDNGMELVAGMVHFF